MGRRPSAAVAAAAEDLPSCSGRCSVDVSSVSSFSVRSGFRLERHPRPQPSIDDWLSSFSSPQAAAPTAGTRPLRPSPCPASRKTSPLAFASLSVSAASASNRGRASSTTADIKFFASATTGASSGGATKQKKKASSGGAGGGSPSSSSASPSPRRSALNYLRHLAAGAASCAVARTTLAPLERMKLEQVLHGAAGASIRETAERVWLSGVAAASSSSSSSNASRVLGGVSAFWRGNGVNLLRTCPHKALNFFAFDTYRSALLTARRARGRKERAERRRKRSSSSAVAGKGGGGGGSDEGQPTTTKRLGLPSLALFSKKDSKHHQRHHIHGGSPAPTTALFDDSDSDSEEEFGAAERFAAGAMAGATATAICFPLDVLRTRVLLAAAAAPSSAGAGAAAAATSAATFASASAARPAALAATLRSIVAREGVGALYSGLAPALAATGPSGAIFYGTYDVLKHLTLRSMERREEEAERREEEEEEEAARKGGIGKFFRRGDPRTSSSSSSASLQREPPRMSARATLACGAAAGAAAELAMYPMEVVRRRMQVASMQLAAAAGAGASPSAALANATTFRGAAASLLRERGAAGLYAGVGPTMLQVLPSAALSYYAYEVFKARFGVVGGVQ